MQVVDEMKYKKLLAGVIYTVMIVMSLLAFLRGLAGTFFINGDDTHLKLLFFYLTRFAWFPLTIFAIFQKRLAAFLMIVCVPSALLVNRQIHYAFSSQATDRIWLASSLLPLVISATVLLMMDAARIGVRNTEVLTIEPK